MSLKPTFELIIHICSRSLIAEKITEDGYLLQLSSKNTNGFRIKDSRKK